MGVEFASTGSRQLDEIAGLIGREAALRISLAYRGLEIFILKKYQDRHPMVEAIGREAADTLSEYFGGTTMTVPATPGLRAEVFRLADLGQLSRQEIAANLNIHERTVYRWLAQRDSSKRQPDLFDEVPPVS